MSKKKLMFVLGMCFLLISCLFISSCSIQQLFKNKIINEIENKYIEYSQTITVNDIEDALVQASEIAASSTVAIRVISGSIFTASESMGSGVIIKRSQNYNNTYRYLVVTNRHVTDTSSASDISVYIGNNQYIDAMLVSYDDDYDLALIAFDSGILLNVATLYTDTLVTGQYAIAIGSPYDIESFYNTVTIGSVSSPNRLIEEEDLYGKSVVHTFIQHDAAINSGNSGGGLYDIYGRLIGINTWKLVGDLGDHFEGLNFAIPASVVNQVFATYLKND